MIKKIKELLPSPDSFYHLADWREWFARAMAILFFFILPLSFFYSFRLFIDMGQPALIVIDLILWLMLFIRAFIPSSSKYLPHFIWLIILYLMTISFFAVLGPHYARPGWLMLCAVIAAIFYGVRGAVFASLFNAAILLLLFFYNAGGAAWARVYDDGLKIWLMFVTNLTILSLCASFVVGFLINRLNSSLHMERKTKEELQKSEEELQEIFNSAHDAFIIHDDEGRILDVNDEMPAMYGISREEALSLRIADISAVDANLNLLGEYWQRTINGESLIFEWQARRPHDDFIFCVEVGLRKLDRRGKQVVLAAVRNLTERKNAEAERQRVHAQLVQAQKMEAVGTLAGGIAHDFNNILGGILGGLNLMEILLRKEDLKNKEKVESYLQTAIKASQRAADITRQLLTLSRKSELQKEPVLLAHSITHVLNICKNSFPKSVELDFRPVDNSLFVYADAAQIEQILLNLCVNASHAMTLMRPEGELPGGHLSVAVNPVLFDREFACLHPDLAPDVDYIEISVQDDGVGINDDGIRRIFEPFYSTKAQDVGTGLGLAITYSIVKQHGGAIEVLSEPGKGSTFKVYLPLLKEISSLAQPEKQELVKGSGLILAVDDEASVLSVAEGILDLCGYRVVTATSADQAIEIFRKMHEEISAVVLDNSMPGMSGINVYIAMRGIDPGVRVMLCSGFMTEATVKQGREIGIREFIDKPYNISEFSRRIKKLLE